MYEVYVTSADSQFLRRAETTPRNQAPSHGCRSSLLSAKITWIRRIPEVDISNVFLFAGNNNKFGKGKGGDLRPEAKS